MCKDCWREMSERLIGYYRDTRQGMPVADALAKYKVTFDSLGQLQEVTDWYKDYPGQKEGKPLLFVQRLRATNLSDEQIHKVLEIVDTTCPHCWDADTTNGICWCSCDE